MIDREHELSVARQAMLFGFSRGNVYYLPRPVADGDLALMRRIDELHLDYPFAGSRMLQGDILRSDQSSRCPVVPPCRNWLRASPSIFRTSVVSGWPSV